MQAKNPRLVGFLLSFVGRLVQFSDGGWIARRLVGAVVDPELDAIDFAAEGEPAPQYMPEGYVRSGEERA